MTGRIPRIHVNEAWGSANVDTWRQLLTDKIENIERRQTTSFVGLYDQVADLTEPGGAPLDAAANYVAGDFYVLSATGVFSTAIPELTGLSGGPGDQIVSDGTQWLLLEYSGAFLSSVSDDTAAGVITFTPPPKSQGAPVAADDLTRKDYVDGAVATHEALQASPDDVHGAQTYTDGAINARLTNWRTRNVQNDLGPDVADQWLGDQDFHPEGMAIGIPTGDVSDPGIQGVVARRSDTPTTDPGIAVVGYVDEQTRIAGVIGTAANAPVEIAGSPVLLMGPAFVEVQNPLAQEQYLLAGQSFTLPDGRHVAPLILGPAYVPPQSESATDTRDIALDGLGTLVDVFLTPLTLANNYSVPQASFRYEIRLSEEGGRAVKFDVEVWLNGGFVFRDEYTLSGQAQNITYAAPITNPLSIGDVIQIRVSAIDSHPQSDGWIRGATRTSLVEARQ